MKKWLLVLLGVSLLLAGCTKNAKVVKPHNKDSMEAVAEPTNPPSKVGENTDTLTGEVIRVLDGNTFVVNLGGKEEKVRLLLVNTPAAKPVQPFGKEANEFTKSILPAGKTVELEFDVEERDEYGHLLAYVYVDGEMLNERLLKEGLARFVAQPPNNKYVDEFGALQENAQVDGLGIWSNDNYGEEEQ